MANEDQVESKLDTLKLENELLSEQAKEAEMKAMIRELHQKYGSNWKKILNLKDNSSLSQFANVRFRLI